MSLFHLNIADLMQFSLEELVRKFNVSPKELRELADKMESEEPVNDDENDDKKKGLLRSTTIK